MALLHQHRAAVPAAVLTLSSLALAAAFAHRPGTETWTEPSGKAAALHADAVTTADYYGLQIVKMWEYDHRPCVLDIEQSTFATRDLSRLNSLRVCEPTVGQLWKQADVGSGQYVTAIAVCTGKSQDDATIHGVELWGASLDDGKLVPAKAPVKLEFPECKKWQAKSACPANAVATGIRGFHDDAIHGLQGLALRCHELEPRGK